MSYLDGRPTDDDCASEPQSRTSTREMERFRQLRAALGDKGTIEVVRLFATETVEEFGRYVRAMLHGDAARANGAVSNWSDMFNAVFGPTRIQTAKHLARTGDLDLCAEQVLLYAPWHQQLIDAVYREFPQAFPSGAPNIQAQIDPWCEALKARQPWLRAVFGREAAVRDAAATPLDARVAAELRGLLNEIVQSGTATRPEVDRQLVTAVMDRMTLSSSNVGRYWSTVSTALHKTLLRGQDDLLTELLDRYFDFPALLAQVVAEAAEPPVRATGELGDLSPKERFRSRTVAR